MHVGRRSATAIALPAPQSLRSWLILAAMLFFLMAISVFDGFV